MILLNHTKRISFVITGCLVAIGLSAGVTYGIRSGLDAYTLSHADPAMITLAMQAGMSRTGELVFLRTHPRLVSDAQMQQVCTDNTAANNGNGFIEQGCYVTSTHRIYLRRMPSNLYKLEVSTAAYEMLHPVYISFNNSDKAVAVNKIIEANYTHLRDADLMIQVANFAKTEPGARDLELFSLLGTGYGTVSTNLHSYYVPYFTNLGATVAANNQIKQLFHQDQSQLEQLKSQISAYDIQAKDAYIASVSQAHAGDQTGDTYYYDAYLQYLNQENATITRYNTLLGSYNALVTEYNGMQPVSQMNQAQMQSQ